LKPEFVEKIVGQIVAAAGTFDVYEIAQTNGVSVKYENWHPVTIGEFERKTKTIRVNLRALTDNKKGEDLEKMIVAHELGHFFAGALGFDKKDEERFARQFAESLVSLSENIKIRK
jgi:predicted SprT family Zn-dependent metalloprotease